MSLIRSVLWMLAGRWSYNIISLASFSIILSQIDPARYGIYVVCSTALILTEVFYADGIENCIVRQNGEINEIVGSAWILAVVSAISFASIFVISVPFLMDIYADSAIPFLMIILAAIACVQGLSAVPRGLLLRLRKNREFSILLSCGNLLGAAVGVGVALQGGSIWSLAAQQATIHVVVLLAAGVLTGGGTALRFSKNMLYSMGHFVWYSLWSAFVNITSNRTDIILISMFFGQQSVGIYGLAKRLVQILQDLVASSFDKVLLSLRVNDRSVGAHPPAFYRQSVIAQSVLVFPCFAGFALVAGEIVPAIFGKEWATAAPLVVLMAGGGILRSMVTIERAEQVADGLVKRILWVRCAEFVISIAILLPIMRWGIEAIAAAFTFRYFLTYVLVVASHPSQGGGVIHRLLKVLHWQGSILLATVAMVISVLALVSVVEVSGFTAFSLKAIVGATAYVAVLYILRSAWLPYALGRTTA